MPDINEDIIQRASQGDTAAFEIIYRAYCRFVYNVSLRIVHSDDDAQEVTQEVFILLYRKLKDFRFQSSLKTWIYRVTINTAVNMSKKWSRERKRQVEYDDQFDTSSVQPDVYQEMDESRREEQTNALLDQLTPDHRVCIVLRSIQGLSYQEIAGALNININTVRSRLKRAREVLMNLRKEVMRHEV